MPSCPYAERVFVTPSWRGTCEQRRSPKHQCSRSERWPAQPPEGQFEPSQSTCTGDQNDVKRYQQPRFGIHHPPIARRTGARSDHGRTRLADLPDLVVSVPRRGSRRAPLCPGRDGQYLHPHHESHHRCLRAPHRRSGRRRGRARFQLGPGRGDSRHSNAVRGRRPCGQQQYAVRRHLFLVCAYPAQAGHRVYLCGCLRPGELPPRAAPQHEALLRRNPGQSPN